MRWFHGGHPDVISVFPCPFASDWLTLFAGPPELDGLPGRFFSVWGSLLSSLAGVGFEKETWLKMTAIIVKINKVPVCQAMSIGVLNSG